MGLDRHGIGFIRYASTKQGLGDVATIGRQGLAITPSELQRVLGKPDAPHGEWGEPMLESLGASLVESFDNSDFEGATHLIDLNKDNDLPRQYDTIIDCGTTEHIFNAPKALRTYTELCKIGGQIIHVLPSNNFNNHGFWQISPELFFSLYTEANGYGETEVFLCDMGERDFWYQVTPPSNGEWSDATSPRAMQVMCRTRKVRDVAEPVVQQASYASSWEEPHAAKYKMSSRQRLKDAIEGTPLFSLARFANRVLKPPEAPLRRNPDLTKRVIVELM